MEDSSNIKDINSPSVYKISGKQNTLNSKIGAFFSNLFRKNNKLSQNFIDEFIDDCEEQNIIASEERKMIKNIVNIRNIKVGDIMIPRINIIAASNKTNFLQIKELINEKEHSRIPIYRDNLDDIIGFIHSKDIVKSIGKNEQNFNIEKIIRKILYIPDSMRIIDLLLKMRSFRVHIAIVLDEYGGTDGLITIEDIMEEIVGEIEDEHDLPDNNIYLQIKKINDNILHVGGRVSIKKISELINLPELLTEENDFDTIGGLFLSTLKKVPEIGEKIEHHSGLLLKILDADDRSVKLIEIIKNIDINEDT